MVLCKECKEFFENGKYIENFRKGQRGKNSDSIYKMMEEQKKAFVEA